MHRMVNEKTLKGFLEFYGMLSVIRYIPGFFEDRSSSFSDHLINYKMDTWLFVELP